MGVRERFVRNILAEEGARMLRNQGKVINAVTKRHTGNLLNKRTVVVSGSEDMDGKLEFSHTVYERFLDIRRLNRRKGNKKIHNRFVFGTYSAIGGRLMYDLTEDVAAALKSEFEDK